MKLWFSLAAEACVLVFLAMVFNASLPVLEVTRQHPDDCHGYSHLLGLHWRFPSGCTLIAIETLRLMADTWHRVRRGGTSMITALVIAFVALLLVATPVSFAMGLAAVVAIVAGWKAAQHDRHPDGRRDGLLPADGHPLLHPGRVS